MKGSCQFGVLGEFWGKVGGLDGGRGRESGWRCGREVIGVGEGDLGAGGTSGRGFLGR